MNKKLLLSSLLIICFIVVAGYALKHVEPLREWILDLKQADILRSSDNLPALKQFVQKVGTNPVLKDTSPRFSVATPFTFATKRCACLLSAAPAARRPSVSGKSENWRGTLGWNRGGSCLVRSFHYFSESKLKFPRANSIQVV